MNIQPYKWHVDRTL